MSKRPIVATFQESLPSAREARDRFQVIGNYGLTYFDNTVRTERYRWLVSDHSTGEPLEEFARYREALAYIRARNKQDAAQP